MNAHFLAKLGEFFRNNKAAIEASEITEEDIKTALKQARSYSGGKQKAENRMVMMSEQFDSKAGDSRVFFEKEFAEPPPTIHVLPKPGTYSHPKWGKFTLTAKAINEFVENHNNHVYQEQIPIDAEHQTKLSGAVGYYGEMRLIEGGKGGAEADVEWTDRGRELIKSDGFKYFSPEYFDTWVDPVSQKQINHVVAGGAITTRPFFKDKVLRPLVANSASFIAGEWMEGDGDEEPRTLVMSAMQFTEEEPEDPKKANLDTADVHVDAPVGEDPPKATNKGGSEVADEPKVVDEVTKTYVEEQTKKLTEELDEEKGLRKAAEERLVKLEGDAKTRRFSDIIRGRDAEGDGSPPFQGEHGSHQTMMSLLAKEYGEDSDEFKAYITTQRDLSKQMREAGLYKEAGASTGTGDTNKADTATKKFYEARDNWLKENPGKSKGDATEAVSVEQPKLYVDYVNESSNKAKAASSRYGYENDQEDDD